MSWLWLSHNEISDLTPLQGLTGMSWLCLSHNEISDLTPLAGLTNLKVLFLDHNQISDLTGLLALPALENLDVDVNPLSDTAITAQIPQLENNGVVVDFSNRSGFFTQPADNEIISFPYEFNIHPPSSSGSSIVYLTYIGKYGDAQLPSSMGTTTFVVDKWQEIFSGKPIAVRLGIPTVLRVDLSDWDTIRGITGDSEKYTIGFCGWYRNGGHIEALGKISFRVSIGEGEGEGEGEGDCLGCTGCDKSDLSPDGVKRLLGDWLIIGLSFCVILSLGALREKA
jgi:hypothetical protein